MVTCCVAFGCKNVHDARNKISYHKFPFKREDILRKWVEAIRRDNWYPSKSSRLCSEHFLDSDYLENPGGSLKLLKPDAVPSIFSFAEQLTKNMLPNRKIVKQVAISVKEENEDIDVSETIILHMGTTIKEENVDIDLEAPSFTSTSTFTTVNEENEDIDLDTRPPTPTSTFTSSTTVKEEKLDIDFETLPPTSTSTFPCVDVGTQTLIGTTIINQLRRKVKTLKQKVRRRDSQLANMKKLLQEIADSGNTNNNLNEVIHNYLYH